MTDDPTSTLAADLPSNINNGTASAEVEESSDGESAKAQIRKRVATQTKRKAECIHDIMFNLDILIYAELCVLYYMEYVPAHLDLPRTLREIVAHSFVSFSAFYSRSCS